MTHFTGKERDAESGLDNFGARYDASSLGRFMSPDPLGGSRRDPQTLNKYAFSRNNPLRFIDPTGLYVVDSNCAKDKKCEAEAKRFEDARQQDLKSKDSAVRSAAEAYGDPGKANEAKSAISGATAPAPPPPPTPKPPSCSDAGACK